MSEKARKGPSSSASLSCVVRRGRPRQGKVFRGTGACDAGPMVRATAAVPFARLGPTQRQRSTVWPSKPAVALQVPHGVLPKNTVLGCARLWCSPDQRSTAYISTGSGRLTAISYGAQDDWPTSPAELPASPYQPLNTVLDTPTRSHYASGLSPLPRRATRTSEAHVAGPDGRVSRPAPDPAGEKENSMCPKGFLDASCECSDVVAGEAALSPP